MARRPILSAGLGRRTPDQRRPRDPRRRPGRPIRFIADELARRGFTASENRVWRICSRQKIFSLHTTKKGRSRPAGPPVHDDLIRRDFTAPAPNVTWLTDITEHAANPTAHPTATASSSLWFRDRSWRWTSSSDPSALSCLPECGSRSRPAQNSWLRARPGRRRSTSSAWEIRSMRPRLPYAEAESSLGVAERSSTQHSPATRIEDGFDGGGLDTVEHTAEEGQVDAAHEVGSLGGQWMERAVA